MTRDPDLLFDLLPAVYRERDAEYGGPLRDLLRVISEQAGVVGDDITQLYENWFIETSDDWAVPYIGDLIGYRPVHEAGEPGDAGTSQGRQRNRILIPRREVANTVRYRRRKGTLALLELLANDVAGWPARAVEFYALLHLAQSINHLRLARGRSVDVRDGDSLDLIDGPFERLAHTVDVRRIVSHRTQGRHNMPSVGVFVWRLRPYSVTRTPAYCLEDVDPAYFTFSVLGNDAPLYHPARPEDELTHIAGELEVPAPIRRRALEHRIGPGHEMRAQASPAYYGDGKSLAIWAGEWAGNDPGQPIPAASVIPADLSDWQYSPAPNHVAVDPVLGRIAFPESQPPPRDARVRVSYHYGFSADMGGGEYNRTLTEPVAWVFRASDLRHPDVLANKLAQPADQAPRELRQRFAPDTLALLDTYAGGPPSEELLRALVREFNRLVEGPSLHTSGLYSPGVVGAETIALVDREPQGRALRALNRRLLETSFRSEIAPSYGRYNVGEGEPFSTISAALQQWRNDRPRHAVIEIADSGVYVERLAVELEAEQTLQVRAANRTRPVLRLLNWETDAPDALRVSGGAGSRFKLDGLLLRGRGVRAEEALHELTIRHCTLVPGWGIHSECQPRWPGRASIDLIRNPDLRVEIDHSIVGAIEVTHDEVSYDPIRIRISDSIVDATSDASVAISSRGGGFAHARCTIARCTVFGVIRTHAIDLAENSIFGGMVHVARRQVGCMRFCYVPPESCTPRRYECQPDLVERAVQMGPAEGRAAAVDRERARVRPTFNSTRYGRPDYCQLAESCADEIARGAEDESELGAFHDLHQPQREANLRARLDEYTPAGMDAGIIHAS